MFGDDVFGDDVKMTVNGEQRVWAGREAGEALVHPVLPYPEAVPAPCQMAGKARPARCCPRPGEMLPPPQGHGGGLNQECRLTPTPFSLPAHPSITPG